MEEMWKKFKDETKDDIEKIMSYLKDAALVKPLDKEPNMFQPRPPEKLNEEISNQIVLDDEKSQNVIIPKVEEISQVQNCVPEVSNVPVDSRKKIYGSLKDTVKELMEKEKISRAQAYRKAKKMMS